VKRSPVSLQQVADWHNLTAAFQLAARGKRDRDEVRRFAARLEHEIAALRASILNGDIAVGQMHAFRIRDPKPRLIHAPCFRERVLHHALMAQLGPVLDRALVFDTYACRVGKGTLAAVQRASEHSRRWPWFVQIDMRAYFASIDHAILKRLLARRFKDAGLLALCGRIIDAYQTAPGRGLPIGALSSQHFANYYLGGLDRLLLEQCRVGGLVRYMDDLVWWGGDRASVRAALAEALAFAGRERGLEIKSPQRVGRSRHGLSFCGFRILPGQLLLSRRRKRLYGQCRRRWEQRWLDGRITDAELQRGFSSAWAMTAHANAAGWRREQLRRMPLDPALAGL